MAHDALYQRAILLDHFKEGLKKSGIFQLISLFPVEMSGLFVIQGTLTSDDVSAALYVDEDEDLGSENELVFNFLQRYIDTLTEEGTLIEDDMWLCGLPYCTIRL